MIEIDEQEDRETDKRKYKKISLTDNVHHIILKHAAKQKDRKMT